MSLIHLLQIPDLALFLILLGILLLYAEFNRPGTILLACLGILSSVFGAYGLAQHQFSKTAAVIAAIGLAFILLQLKFNSRNVLAILGALILTAALVALVRPPAHIDPLPALIVVTVFTVVTLWLGRIAVQARRNKRVGRVD